MPITKLEIKRNSKNLLVWSLSIAVILIAFMLLFPQMKTQLDGLTIFNSQLGKVFGMDKLSVASSIGYFASMSMVITVGGAIFACLISILAVSNEEKYRTVEYLLSHPISRKNILIQKFISIILRIILFNLICVVCSFLPFFFTYRRFDWHWSINYVFHRIKYFTHRISVDMLLLINYKRIWSRNRNRCSTYSIFFKFSYEFK